MPENHFGEDVASQYDASTADMPVEPVVDFLAERAGGGPVLELAIGTGRIALPLAARGLRVHGIDLSEAMVARLREKPGGDELPVTIGDYATTRVDGTFTLAYLVYNSIQNQTTQDAQVASFENVAAHLEPRGRFVIEVGIPDVRGERLRIFDFGGRHVGIDEYDVANQALISHHYTRGEDGSFRCGSGPFRYVWPSELDLMARIAGLTPTERYSGWNGEPFTSESTKLVAVWQKGSDPEGV
ncbi:MAG TPA: class I SAM-dependent methyltransferase [Gaiellaceae bacterium]|nr:class I SAM-dependent methyltransferase [Gaiellaceae bacterium]